MILFQPSDIENKDFSKFSIEQFEILKENVPICCMYYTLHYKLLYVSH